MNDTKPSSGSGPMTIATTAGTSVQVALAPPPHDSARAIVTGEGARYRAQGLLGRGGMGEVRLVEDGLIGRAVAVKTIAHGLADSRDVRDRFLREVRIQGQLEHPAIVPVYDMGIDEHGNDYFTMKRIAGRTLATVLRALADADGHTVSEFPRNALLAVFRQVCLAVAYAHSRGVVHRDLKPANVMVGDFGEVYVLDWGIAHLVNEVKPPPEGDSDEILGTPGYMSPEQLANPADVDARSDVYALGSILFELLALEPWHQTRNATAAMASTMTEERARPAERAPDRDIPPELDDVCARATAARREDRVQTARELAELVEHYLEGDRDLERRRVQAQRHAQAAREARQRVTAGGAGSVEARREALREAGRAVALDPEGREGLRAALELMLEVPAEVPPEVHAELERAQSDRIRAGIVPGMLVFATLAVTALIVPLIAGPVSWLVPGAINVSLGIAIALCAMLRRRASLANEKLITLALAVCVTFAIAVTSGYLGPMMIIPPLAVAFANALATSQSHWRVFMLLSSLSILVPTIVEWIGLVPRSYEFYADGFFVRPVVTQLAEVPIRLLCPFVTIAVIIGSVLYVRRIVVVEATLRRSWVMQNWHLRQMAQMSD